VRPLEPGEARRVTVPAREAWECRCARCGHAWVSKTWDIPKSCPGCKHKGWRSTEDRRRKPR